MDYEAYTSPSTELAIDLANIDPSEPAAIDAFLAAHHEWLSLRTRLTLRPDEREEIAAVAAMIRAVAAATDEESVIERLNALLAKSAPHPRVTNHDGRLHVHYSRDRSNAVEQLTTTVAVGITLLVTAHGWKRLGICSATDCQDVYIDTSRNQTRRFCSGTCSSRSSVAAYRARQRQRPGRSPTPTVAGVRRA
ncbi:MAG: CGNR zinc finger domain-containing protein [Geodermatophilaceae bacterium]|nr:CGNR zinc finger domain-containing protein [Geodermatophilaceae bacterium]